MKVILAALTALVTLAACSAAGVSRDELLDAIEAVESRRGTASKNLYQIRWIYYRDWCRVYGERPNRRAYASIVCSRSKSRKLICMWWDHWVSKGHPDTPEALARMHNGGPEGYRRHSTAAYWVRVYRELEKSRKEKRRWQR